jgi:hypothetical protein
MPKQENQSRRDFLKVAAGLSGLALVGGGYLLKQYFKPDELTDQLWRLNPAFRLNEISAWEIELFTHLGNGQRLQHRFQGLEADLLRQIAAEKILNGQITVLAQKYHLTEDVCRKQIQHSIKEFSQSCLIYTGEKLMAKIVEVKNG